MLALGCRDFIGPEPAADPGVPVFSHAGTSPGLDGAGSTGPGLPLPGADRQDFEFDVAWDLTGGLFYRDWSFIRIGGTVATITVDPSDISTWLAAMRDGSTACADPTRGAEIDGTGRLDTGELVRFTIVACDNGPSGSGADVFRMSVPRANGYERGGLLSSGDVVKSSGTAPEPSSTAVSGLGAIGAGPATLGSDHQEFDFDIDASPGGRLVFSDYSVVRNGLPGRMTVDPATDAATGITSFHQTSGTCVRFGGTGRIDTGELKSFYIDACDNASPGDGFDRLAITLPDRNGPGVPYTRSGTLSAGDISLSGSAAPATGNLDVTTTTTGSSLDTDGYTVTVGGTNSQPIAINGTVTFTGLSSGEHSVALSGVAANCTVSDGSSRTVDVTAGGTASIAFAVSCAPTPATQLAFTVQPTNTMPMSTIQPAVQVTALDAQGNHTTSFTGLVTIAIGRNGGFLRPGTLSGTTTVSAVNGVATFPDLRIDEIGDGYTLRVTAAGLTGAESGSFNIGL